MRALTLNRAESCWFTTILRPLMPPAALHHLLNTSAVSNSSWSRPGRPAKPGSAKVPTLISVGVTPCAVDPAASPFWQTSLRVPKSPDAGAAAVVVDEVEELLPLSESLRPHPAASTTTHVATTIHPLRTIVSPNPFTPSAGAGS